MDEAVPAAVAKRKFSQLLQNVRQGSSYVVTSHEKAVAKITPVDDAWKIQASARATLLVRLRRQSVTKAVRSTRGELYQDRQ
jgi:prevent-host-death family protein